jgi:hypothetical protein
MKLSVGCNWDMALLEGLAPVAEVTDLCGVIPKTVIGAGKPAHNLPNPTAEHIAAFVREAHLKGKTVTIQLDAPHMEATEFEPETHRQLLALFGWLQEIGVDWIELAITYLMELVREQFPKLKVKVSYNNRVGTVDQALFLKDMGAAMIGIEQMCNRNFPLLAAFAADVGVPIQLLLTSDCLRGCPNYSGLYHMCTTCNMTSTRLEQNPWVKFSGTYCLSYRDALKLRDTTELVKGNFIRPEDVCHYEALGIEEFKLDTAANATEDIVEKVGFYVRRRFDGNLLHLVNMLSIGHKFQVDKEGRPRLPPLPDWTEPSIRAFFEFRETPGLADRLIRIDNRQLDGLLAKFLERPCPPACGDCDWCDRYAGKAISVDEELRERFCSIMEEYRKAVISGRYLPPDKRGN